MYIDREKAVVVFTRLLEAYKNKQYPYDLPETVPPQIKANLPQSMVWGSREHACFLFALCYWMRGGIDSHTATRLLAKVFDAKPEFFYPEYDFKLRPEFLSIIFQWVGLGFNAKEISEAWLLNWGRMNRLWDSDPRNLVEGITNYEEACERIQNHGKKGFKGFQEKMVSMLIYFYMDAGIIDRWYFPIPVDFHVLRICFANEIIVCKAAEANANGFYTRPVLQAIRDLCMGYCQEHSIDPVLLCEALWLYSRTMCDQHPGNRSIIAKREGRKTIVSPMPRWSLAQTRTFERTCGACCIASSCRWNIASAVYYIQGRVDLRGRRDTPLQKLLFPILP